MRIQNRCSKSPRLVEWKVRRSLKLIPPNHLLGLDSLCLLDEMPDVSAEAADWARRAKAEDKRGYGYYCPSDAGNSAYVVLYVRPICRCVPWFLWWTSVPTLRIARTLAHEVAHHLIATRGYVFHPGDDSGDVEALANHYANSLLEKVTRRAWYKLGQWLINDLANGYFGLGILDWREGKYAAAAERWSKAWDLNPNRKDAAYWYWKAREKCGSARAETLNHDTISRSLTRSPKA